MTFFKRGKGWILGVRKPEGGLESVSLSPETVMVCAVLRDHCRSQHRVGKSWSRRWGSEGGISGIIWDTSMLSRKWRQDLNYGLTIDGLFESGFPQWWSSSEALFIYLLIYLFITYRRAAPQGNPNILMDIDIGPLILIYCLEENWFQILWEATMWC